MKPVTSVQLYSVREQATQNYAQTIRDIAAMGFPVVETAGFPGSNASEAGALFKELKISAPSCHSALPIGENKHKIIEDAQKVGTKYIVTGCSPKFREDFKSVDAIKACAELYCEAADFAKGFGIQVGYHNHDWEMATLDGKPAYKWFLENTPDSVLWEADIFWVTFGGLDPVAFVTEIGVRGKLIHFKDGVIAKKGVFKEVENASGKVVESSSKPFRPAGTGDVNLQGVAAVAKHCEYAVVELDSYDGDMMGAVKKSYDYLTTSGISTGNK